MTGTHSIVVDVNTAIGEVSVAFSLKSRRFLTDTKPSAVFSPAFLSPETGNVDVSLFGRVFRRNCTKSEAIKYDEKRLNGQKIVQMK